MSIIKFETLDQDLIHNPAKNHLSELYGEEGLRSTSSRYCIESVNPCRSLRFSLSSLLIILRKVLASLSRLTVVLQDSIGVRA
jgi:hypothetical protein